jgi:hypothetical protein
MPARGSETNASRRHGQAERRRRFGLLLVSISAVFAVEGIAEPGPWSQAIASVLLAITVTLSLRVADARPEIMRPIAMITGILTAVAIVAAVAGHGRGIAVAGSQLLLVAVAPAATMIGTLRTLRLRNEVTTEAVFGVLCLYVLLGMLFAFLYAVIALLNGGALFTGHQVATMANCLYYSFTTLTTVGYGDLTVASNLGHTLSVSEALVGQIYLVTVVSLIVGNLGLRRREPAGGR